MDSWINLYLIATVLLCVCLITWKIGINRGLLGWIIASLVLFALIATNGRLYSNPSHERHSISQEATEQSIQGLNSQQLLDHHYLLIKIQNDYTISTEEAQQLIDWFTQNPKGKNDYHTSAIYLTALMALEDRALSEIEEEALFNALDDYNDDIELLGY
ncbi:MAG: hypothetical protein AAGF06_06970 [Pseudomonadota bacterium]